MRFQWLKVLDEALYSSLLEIWNAEYPHTIEHPHIKDLMTFVNSKSKHDHLLVFDENERVIAWFFRFLREEEYWFSMLITKNHQRKGLGSQILKKAQQKFNILNGWVVDKKDYLKQDGTFYPSPVDFYLKLGFELDSNTRLEVDQISCVKMSWRKVELK